MMKTRFYMVPLLLLVSWSIYDAKCANETPPLIYPETRVVDQVDTFHGIEVKDPYRWLEADIRESAEVKEWTKEQNKLTNSILDTLPMRESFKQRLTEMYNYERYSTPVKKGGKYFYRHNSGLQNQSVLYVLDSLEGEPRVLLDPNTLSEDGTTALGSAAISNDAKYVAYSLAESGSDWNTWYVKDIESGKTLDDKIEFTKFTQAVWTKDNLGFFYARFPKPDEDFQDTNLNQKIYYHRVGTSQSDDTLVYERLDHPEWGFSNAISEDGRYLIITIWVGTAHRYRVYYKDLSKPNSQPKPLIDEFENDYSFIGSNKSLLYFITDKDAPLRRVIAIDINQPQPANWQEIIPEGASKLEGVSFIGGKFVASYLQDVKSVVKVYKADGSYIRDIPLPGIGRARGFTGKQTDSETFYAFESFNVPTSIYRYNLNTNVQTQYKSPEVPFSPDAFEVKQVFYNSKDSTRVPMFIISKKGVELDGDNALVLYGYGGFNISIAPRFSPSSLSWVDKGGVLAIANIRGGGEYGEQWHEAGTKLKKQNVFDDFIYAAKWLVANKYTKPTKLGINGGSNGGLLVGAVLNQAPELFGAAVPEVGVMDMLRFNKFTAGRYWVDDYGSPEVEQEFKALRAYSPYHNIEERAYPPTMVKTADTDDRVVPGHSFKYIAQLQAKQQGNNPVVIRIESSAGHGAGTPTSKRIQSSADTYAFFAKYLGLK